MSETYHDKLRRFTHCRVRVQYEAGDTHLELPFIVGVLADLSGQTLVEWKPLAQRRFIPIDRDNFDNVMACAAPRVAFGIPSTMGPQRIDLRFRTLADFGPAGIAAQVPELQALVAATDDANVQRRTALLNDILHHPELQRLEGTWRGLWHLVSRTETGEMLKIRVMNVRKEELQADVHEATAFDQTTLFMKVHEEVYGTYGGQPCSLLIGDFAFDCRLTADVGLLRGIAATAEAAQAVFVASVSPRSFNMERFAELDHPRNLAKIFVGPDYDAWHAFRDSDESRHVALVLPRVLAREVYGEQFEPVKKFDFEESIDGTDSDKYLWMSAAWCYAANVTEAFAKYGWLARIRGVEGGGKVDGLPVHTFPTDDGDVVMKCPTEIGITDDREHELELLGFLPLIHIKGQSCDAFLAANTPHKRKLPDRALWTTTLHLSPRNNALLCLFRFTQIIMVMVRDRMGAFLDAAELEVWLNGWIGNYVLAVENPYECTDDVKAARPLAWTRIEVAEVNGQPGAYRITTTFRPHFQLEPLDYAMQFAAKQLSR